MLPRISPIVKFILILAFSGLACNFSALGAEPTVNSVETEAAATVAAMLTEESKALPTATSLPAATETAAPTVAPSKTATLLPTSTATEVKPDTLAIVYIKDGNVVLWNAADGSRTLTTSGDVLQVSIAEDGAVVAYTRGDLMKPERLEIWAVDSGSQPTPRVLVSAADFKALLAQSPYPTALALQLDQFIFRPGTHEVAFGTAPVFDGPGYLPFHDLRLVNADTQIKQTPFDFKQGGRFSFSPDGKRVALSRPDSISLANYDGTGLVSNVITFPQVITYSEYQYHPVPIWAADSASLRVAVPPEDPMAEPAQLTNLWSIPASGSSPVLLSKIPAIGFAWPKNAFSPDLNQVAYIKQVGEPAENLRELHIAKPDGSGDRAFLQAVSLEFYNWSPDSLHFTYRIVSGTSAGFYLGNSENDGTQITNSIEIIWMGWLDENRYLYTQKAGDFWELRLGNIVSGTYDLVDKFSAATLAYDSSK